jgi:hypothetical protein
VVEAGEPVIVESDSVIELPRKKPKPEMKLPAKTLKRIAKIRREDGAKHLAAMERHKQRARKHVIAKV